MFNFGISTPWDVTWCRYALKDARYALWVRHQHARGKAVQAELPLLGGYCRNISVSLQKTSPDYQSLRIQPSLCRNLHIYIYQLLGTNQYFLKCHRAPANYKSGLGICVRCIYSCSSSCLSDLPLDFLVRFFPYAFWVSAGWRIAKSKDIQEQLAPPNCTTRFLN